MTARQAFLWVLLFLLGILCAVRGLATDRVAWTVVGVVVLFLLYAQAEAPS